MRQETPKPAPSVEVTRPDGTLAKGQYAVPAWTMATLGIALVVAVGVFFWWRQRRHRLAQDGSPHSIPPSSRPPPR